MSAEAKADDRPVRRELDSVARYGHGEVCRVLEEEPDLAEGLSDEDRRAAVLAFRARVISVTQPRWDPPTFDPARTFGLLVLDGLLGRRVRAGSAVATELLSCGDILRPWDEPFAFNAVPPEADWRVFRPARLAVLDEHITALIGRRPELVVNFSSRLLRRARSVAYLMAISHQSRLEDKLMATMWHIASNWGRVTRDGVIVPFRLTHEVLGEILGSQRPSVTMALGRLQAQNRLARRRDGSYVLLAQVGDAPASPPEPPVGDMLPPS